MKIVLIGGFLGSGKTTFIRYFAKYLVGVSENKVVIIENEVGEVGIDDQFLSKEGLMVKELFGGCICCQITGDLTLTVNKLAEQMDPEWLLIETTGIAKPEAIISTLIKYGKGIDSICTLIITDASRWFELTEIMPDLIHAQTKAGDLILINKIDETTAEELDTILAGVKNLNADAQLYTLSALNGIEENLIRRLTDHASSCGKKINP